MENQQTKKLRHFNIRWKLVIFDLCILAVTSGVVFGFCISGIRLSPQGIILHFLLVSFFMTLSRLIGGVYFQVWRYGGVESYIRLIISDMAGSLIYYQAQFLLPLDERVGFVWMFSICATSLIASLGSRLVYRYAYKSCRRDTPLGHLSRLLLSFFIGDELPSEESPGNKIRIAIVGAGNIGTALAEELLNNPRSSYIPHCFIEVDSMKAGRIIYGIPVIPEREVNADKIRELGIQELVFAFGQDNERTRELYDRYADFGCKMKVYDYPIMDSVSSSSGRRHMREFDVEELLFRQPLAVMDETVVESYKGQTVMITGGGGSIGSELCRQIAKMEPGMLIVLDVYENCAYELQQELKFAYGDKLNVRLEIVSVCNRAALEAVFERYHPQTVIHAAAHKHVPFMEHNCAEAVENNVFGTLNVVELSEKYGAERFVMVSTDKAVNPTNVMGATKRMCEMIVLSHAKKASGTKFSATRFGNVLGSAGSVIPLFRRQIAGGGPVTITDKRIIRYFMTIPEASQLVLVSSAMAKNGELFVLDMGKPVRILDLAENMIRLSGYTPGKEIQIVETGLRPGEKLYEELLVRTEQLDHTENSLIFIERDEPLGPAELERRLDILRSAVDTQDNDEVREALREVVETYKDPSEVNERAEQSREMQCVV